MRHSLCSEPFTPRIQESHLVQWAASWERAAGHWAGSVLALTEASLEWLHQAQGEGVPLLDLLQGLGHLVVTAVHHAALVYALDVVSDLGTERGRVTVPSLCSEQQCTIWSMPEL